jgi:hypothetical protein
MKKLVVGLLALVSVSAMAKDRASQFDTDGDKRVSLVELSAKCEVRPGLFARADKNGDGVLSNAEMQTAKEYLFTRCNKEEKNA